MVTKKELENFIDYILAEELKIPRGGLKLYYNKDFKLHLGAFSPRLNSIFLSKSLLKKYNLDPRSTLAHELRHFYQHKKGWLSFSKKFKFAYWKGQKYSVRVYKDLGQNDLKSYYEIPWEKDALKFQIKIRNKYGIEISKHLYKLGIVK